MSSKAASTGRLRALERAHRAKNITELIKTREHHLLANEGEDIIVFGDKTTVVYMSTAPIILCDWTFKCIQPGYTQLYIFTR